MALAPFGLLTAVLIKFGENNLWYALILIPPLAAVRYSLEFSVKEFVIRDQSELEDALRKADLAVQAEKEANKQLTYDLDRKVEELSIYYEMGQELGESPDLERTLDIILLMIQKLILYQSCVIFTKEKGVLMSRRAVTPYKDILEMSALLHLKEETINLVMKNRRPILIPDMREHEDEQRIFKDERSIMCVPLIIKNELIGIIYVGAQRPGAYNDDKLYQLSILANSAANAIYLAMHYENEKMLKQQREEDLRRVEKEKESRMKLWKLGQDLSNSLSMDTTLQIVVEKMRELVDYQSCVILLQDSTRQELRAAKFLSPYAEYFKSFVLRYDEPSVIHLALTHKRTVLIGDIRKLEEPSVLENERCVIVAPLASENEIIGIIYIGAAEPESIDYDAMELVDEASVQIAMAIKNAQLYEKTMAHAITDGVTGLFTHRYFQEKLTQEIAWADRTGRKVAVVMVDMDHFKQFNDTLGHPEGDKLLGEISSLLGSYAKAEDTVCRYGGDEFTLILKDSTKERAMATAERIREAFQLRFGVYAVKITSSIGVAVYPDDAPNKMSLMACVDGAMYRSKRGGRNRVTGASSSDIQLAEDIQKGKVKPLPR
jgi:diguanylate cyclase (GGDEF)-like protein